MTPDYERIKLERLRGLIASGYRVCARNSTDGYLVLLARRFERDLFEHPRMFQHGDDRVIVFHADCEADDLAARVQRTADEIADRWRCEIRVAFGEHLNFYLPASARAFELRRHHRVRAKHRERFAYA